MHAVHDAASVGKIHIPARLGTSSDPNCSDSASSGVRVFLAVSRNPREEGNLHCPACLTVKGLA